MYLNSAFQKYLNMNTNSYKNIFFLLKLYVYYESMLKIILYSLYYYYIDAASDA